MLPNKVKLKPIPEVSKDDPIENLAQQLREIVSDRKVNLVQF